jgi:RNA recognition motif-containing protein
MGKRLYVGNLPYDADEASLREAFGQEGRVVERVHIVLDRETQRPRGFAFVEMASEEQAKAAIVALDGTVLGTRQLRVTEAEDRRPAPGGPRPERPRPERPSGGPPGAFGGGSGGGGGAGGGAGGGPPRHADPARGNRFGPDARPRREREQERRPAAGRRRHEEGDDEYHGRRGNRRFDDDDDE